MVAVILLWPVLLVSLSMTPVETIPLYNLFNNAVNRAQHLHQLAADIYKEFERTLLPGSRQLGDNSPLAGCYSDSIPAPTGKDETQMRSDGDLLRISSALIESWVYPLKTFSEAFSNSLMFGTSDRIYEKLEDLSRGIDELMRGHRVIQNSLNSLKQMMRKIFQVNLTVTCLCFFALLFFQTLGEGGIHLSMLMDPYENFDVILRTDAARMKNYGLLACFKKDMHKVETYLKVTKCRRFGESNCTL